MFITLYKAFTIIILTKCLCNAVRNVLECALAIYATNALLCRKKRRVHVIKRVFRYDTHKTFMISQTAGADDSLWAIMRRVYRLTLYKPIK